MMLKDLSLEELWELFPISFTDYNENFKRVYLAEENILKTLLGNYIKRISHIGSTAINNIKTKPIVDILIEIGFDNKEIV
nr:GrpB family protein [Eubacterium sp.]